MNAQVHPEIKIDRNGNGGAINAQIISLLHLVDETSSIPDACDMARKLMDAYDQFEAAVQANAKKLYESLPFTEASIP